MRRTARPSIPSPGDSRLAVRAFPIPREALEAIVEGVESDLDRRTYETAEDLYPYCYRVASAVGLCAIEIFGYTDPRARQYAVDLGMALQLTNIVRDVGADAQAGRVYLPQEDLRAFGVTADDLRDGRLRPGVCAADGARSGARAELLSRGVGQLSAGRRPLAGPRGDHGPHLLRAARRRSSAGATASSGGASPCPLAARSRWPWDAGCARATPARRDGVLPWAADTVRDGGCIHFLAGGGGEVLPLPLGVLYARELTVTATYSSSPAELREAHQLIASGAVRTAELVSHRLPLERLAEGVALMQRHQALKVYVTP